MGLLNIAIQASGLKSKWSWSLLYPSTLRIVPYINIYKERQEASSSVHSTWGKSAIQAICLKNHSHPGVFINIWGIPNPNHWFPHVSSQCLWSWQFRASKLNCHSGCLPDLEKPAPYRFAREHDKNMRGWSYETYHWSPSAVVTSSLLSDLWFFVSTWHAPFRVREHLQDLLTVPCLGRQIARGFSLQRFFICGGCVQYSGAASMSFSI